jgi:hypothetical protein
VDGGDCFSHPAVDVVPMTIFDGGRESWEVIGKGLAMLTPLAILALIVILAGCHGMPDCSPRGDCIPHGLLD